MAAPAALARHVTVILDAAGLQAARGEEEWFNSGYRVSLRDGRVEVRFHAQADWFEPSWSATATAPGDPAQALAHFRRHVERTILATYISLLSAAGFTVTAVPENIDTPPLIEVTAGPSSGVATWFD